VTLWRVYVLARLSLDKIFKDVPPGTLANLILEGEAEDHTAMEARMALSFPRGYSAKDRSVLATQLRQHQSHWQQHDGLFYH
jgi:hypothetical protein